MTNAPTPADVAGLVEVDGQKHNVADVAEAFRCEGEHQIGDMLELLVRQRDEAATALAAMQGRVDELQQALDDARQPRGYEALLQERAAMQGRVREAEMQRDSIRDWHLKQMSRLDEATASVESLTRERDAARAALEAGYDLVARLENRVLEKPDSEYSGHDVEAWCATARAALDSPAPDGGE